MDSHGPKSSFTVAAHDNFRLLNAISHFHEVNVAALGSNQDLPFAVLSQSYNHQGGVVFVQLFQIDFLLFLEFIIPDNNFASFVSRNE